MPTMTINAAIKHFTTTDNIELYYQHWIPLSPNALIIYVHDLGDHIGRHQNMVRYFVERNYAVALFDQRGFGRSDRVKGEGGQFGEFVNDLSTFIHLSRNAAPKGTPIFLIGHGVGGQFIINLLVPAWNAVKSGFVSHPGKVKGFIALAPFIEPILRISSWKIKIEERLVNFMPRFKTQSILESKDLSLDERLVKSYEEDPLVNKKISLRLRKQIIENTQIIMAMASRIQIPAFMLHGGADPKASPEGTKKFFSRLPSFPKELLIYDDLLHELTNSGEGENIFCEIDRWIQEVCNFSSSKEPIRLSKENICGPLQL